VSTASTAIGRLLIRFMTLSSDPMISFAFLPNEAGSVMKYVVLPESP
jgi:hypothetical protein